MQVRNSNPKSGSSNTKNDDIMRMIHKILNTGPMSRTELVSFMGISHFITANLISELIDSNIGFYTNSNNIKKIDKTKPRHQFYVDINEASCFSSCIFVTESKITIALTTLRLKVLENKTWNYTPTNETDFYNLIKGLFTELLNNNCLERNNIIGATFVVSPRLWQMFEMKITDGVLFGSKFCEAMRLALGVPVFLQTISAAGGYRAFENFFKEKENPVILYADCLDYMNVSFVMFSDKVKRVIQNNMYIGDMILDLPQNCLPEELSMLKLKNFFSFNSIYRQFLKLVPEDKQILVEQKMKFFSKSDKINYIFDKITQSTAFEDLLRPKLERLVLILYNIASCFSCDKVVISNLPSLRLVGILKRVVFRQLGSDYVEKYLFYAENYDDIVYGGCTNTISEGFLNYYLSITSQN